MLENARIYPIVEGHIEIRPLAGCHVGIIVFDQGYGSSEFARGSLPDCLEQAAHLMREGSHHPPSHEAGAPMRWHMFPHDGSHRTTLPGGELRILAHGGTWFLVHVRRDGCCVFGHGTQLELIELAEANYSRFEAYHRPLSIDYRGRRYNLKLTTASEDLAAVTADDGTRFSVRINADDRLHLERLVGGERSTLKMFASAFDGLPEPLWSDVDEPRPPQSGPTRPVLGPIRPSAGTPPAGPLAPEVREATLAMLEYLAMLSGAGKCVRLWCRAAFVVFAERGIRVRGRGEELLKQLKQHSDIALPGGMRVFRYAMATCRELGLLVSDGTLDVFPFDDLHDPASDFARSVVAVFGKAAPTTPGNNVPSASAAPGVPTSDDVSPAAPAPEATASHPTATQDAPDGAPPTPPAAPPTAPPAELYPVDTWPFRDTLEACEAEGTDHLGGEDACDPGGFPADEVNWFGHPTHVPDGITFTRTSIGLELLEPAGPIGEEFYENLAKRINPDPVGDP
mgnify:CR=1 FL=1